VSDGQQRIAVGFCRLCLDEQGEPLPLLATELLDHLRKVHGMDVKLETWPDGSPVVVDHTLEPEDFEPEVYE
jgi:hypothetical protein